MRLNGGNVSQMSVCVMSCNVIFVFFFRTLHGDSIYCVELRVRKSSMDIGVL